MYPLSGKAVLVTGSHGSGKSEFCKLFCDSTSLLHVDVNAMIKKYGWYQDMNLIPGFAPKRKSALVYPDVNLVIAGLSDIIRTGDVAIDYADGIQLPLHWFRLIIYVGSSWVDVRSRLLEKRWTAKAIEAYVTTCYRKEDYERYKLFFEDKRLIRVDLDSSLVIHEVDRVVNMYYNGRDGVRAPSIWRGAEGRTKVGEELRGVLGKHKENVAKIALDTEPDVDDSPGNGNYTNTIHKLKKRALASVGETMRDYRTAPGYRSKVPVLT